MPERFTNNAPDTPFGMEAEETNKAGGRALGVLALVAMVVAAPVSVGVFAQVARIFTQQVPTVLFVALAAAWTVEMVLYTVFSVWIFRRKIRSLRAAGRICSPQDERVELHRAKSRYVLAGVVLGALLGYACYGVFRDALQVWGDMQAPVAQAPVRVFDWKLAGKIALSIVALIFLVLRIRKKSV